MTLINPEEFVGWKYDKYKDRFNYVEWIYMNMIQDDITAILTYGVASQFAKGTVVARIYRDNEILDLRNYMKNPKVFELSKENSSITIDDCFIRVDKDNQNRFAVKGHLEEKGHELRWDLEYNRLVPKINAMDAEKVGWFDNEFFSEWLSWQIKMPTTKINGVLNVDGKEYDIDTMGYMDSNWGQWLLIDAHWNWLHTFGMHDNSPYAIASVEIRGNPHCGDCYVRTPEQEIRFFKNKKEFEFKHLEWEKDKETKHLRPTKTKLIGRSLEGHTIDLLATNITPYSLIQKFPNIPDCIVKWDMLEALVHVQGIVKDSEGKEMFKVDSNGFKEYGLTGGIVGKVQRFLGGD